MQKLGLSIFAVTVAFSVTLTSCGDEGTIKSQKNTYSAKTSSTTMANSEKKRGESLEDIDELSSTKPNAPQTTNNPDPITEISGTSGITATGATASTGAPTYEAGQILRSRKDSSMSVQIDLIGDGGASIKSMIVKDQSEGSSQSLPDMCKKGGTTKLKITFVNSRSKTKGDKCYFVGSNSASKMRIDVDMRGDSDWCKPGEDDTFEFSCPNSSIEAM